MNKDSDQAINGWSNKNNTEEFIESKKQVEE